VHPLVRHQRIDVRRVNARLRAAVVADQREYRRQIRGQKPGVPYARFGVYETSIDPRFRYATTRVVSFLMPVKRELFRGQHGGDGWLGITVLVPSGERVTIADLFANNRRGLRVLAREWRSRIGRCASIYPEAYTATIQNYRQFALTRRGLVVGSQEIAACYRLSATVPYRVLRPHLSATGKSLVRAISGSRG
jgi:hypothetical protein